MSDNKPDMTPWGCPAKCPDCTEWTCNHASVAAPVSNPRQRGAKIPWECPEEEPDCTESTCNHSSWEDFVESMVAKSQQRGFTAYDPIPSYARDYLREMGYPPSEWGRLYGVDNYRHRESYDDDKYYGEEDYDGEEYYGDDYYGDDYYGEDYGAEDNGAEDNGMENHGTEGAGPGDQGELKDTPREESDDAMVWAATENQENKKRTLEQMKATEDNNGQNASASVSTGSEDGERKKQRTDEVHTTA
ncbi:hypothetical protein F4861DRAFT_544312 [Xylaria intraflava]|nr:hypothetical protein F4861DRAFT_544312 [Xylaria intraflava]